MELSMKSKIQEVLEQLVVSYKGKFGITDDDVDQALTQILAIIREGVPKKEEILNPNAVQCESYELGIVHGKNDVIDQMNKKIGD